MTLPMAGGLDPRIIALATSLPMTHALTLRNLIGAMSVNSIRRATGVFLCLLHAGCGFVQVDRLNSAAFSGHTKRVSELLINGVEVNGRGMHAMTPLMS